VKKTVKRAGKGKLLVEGKKKMNSSVSGASAIENAIPRKIQKIRK